MEHQSFEGETNPDLISDFAQYNSKSLLSHPNVSKNSWWSEHNHHVCPNHEKTRSQKSSEHKVLSDSTTPHFLIFSTSNGLGC